MNQIEKEFFPLLDMTHKMRDAGVSLLAADDLAFDLPGCPTVGELLTEMGNVERAYTTSFQSYVLDFSVNAPDHERVTSGHAVVGWLGELDAELKSVLSGLSDDDLAEKQVDRGGWEMSVVANFHTYREAVLILMGKLDLYLRALGKERPEGWVAWIG